MNHRSSTNPSALVPEQGGTVEPPAIGGRPFVPEQVGRVNPGEDGADWFAQPAAAAQPDAAAQPGATAQPGAVPRSARTPRKSDGDGHELFTHVVVPTQRVALPAARGGAGPVPAVPEETERIQLRRLLTGEPEPAAGPSGDTSSRPGSIGRFGRGGAGSKREAAPAGGDVAERSRSGAPGGGRPGSRTTTPAGTSVPEQRRPAGSSRDRDRVEGAQPAGSKGDRGRVGGAQPAGSSRDRDRAERPQSTGSGRPPADSKRGRGRPDRPAPAGSKRAARDTGDTSGRSRRKKLIPVAVGAALAAAVALVSAGATGSLVSGGPEDTQTLAAAAPAALDPAQVPGRIPGPAAAGALPGQLSPDAPAAGSPAAGPADGSPAAPAAGPAAGSPAAASAAGPADGSPAAARPPARAAASPTPAAERKRAAPKPAVPAPATPPRMIMVIRHGEKPGDTPGAGVDPAGNPDDHSLTPRGWDRARSLSALFAPTSGATKSGLARPKTIYAASPTGEGTGQRTRETVQPLAGKLGVPVNTSFGKGQEAALVRSAVAQSQRGPVLISWQHGEIPSIASALKVVGPQPPSSWPDSRYDMVWTFTQAGPGTWKFSQTPQMLLPGDRRN